MEVGLSYKFMKNKKIKVAVIGCGRISVMHFDGIFALGEQVKLVACCDNKPKRADYYAQKFQVKAYYDYKKMLDTEELDAVHICLPHYLHTEVAEYAFEKPRRVDGARYATRLGRAAL